MKSIEDVSMSNADNGVLVSWTECEEGTPGQGSFTNREYDYKKLVFKESELDEAFATFKAKFLEAKYQSKEEESKEF